MDLSIIIINWNSADYIKQCLESIYDKLESLEYEIIVVDNATYDGSESIVSQYRNAIYIQSEKNLGFGKANNLGVQHSKGSVLLFLNPDTKMLGSAIASMYHSLCELPGAGVIGCRILNPDLSVQTSCVQFYPTILNQILDSDYFNNLILNQEFFNQIKPIPVEVISGACLMIKRDVFMKVGGFTADYFMYTEDIDLCRKVKDSGFGIYYLGGAEIIHYGSGSTQKSGNDFGNVMMRESIFKYFRMRKGFLSANLYRLSMLISSLIRITLIYIFLQHLKKSNRYRCSFKKWQGILKWSLGLEKWASELK